MKENIVFLDSSTVDYGDIDFSAIAELGNLKCYPATKKEEIIERCNDASIVITNKVVFDEDTIKKCSKLTMIAEAATGYNNIDIASDNKKRISLLQMFRDIQHQV